MKENKIVVKNLISIYITKEKKKETFHWRVLMTPLGGTLSWKRGQ